MLGFLYFNNEAEYEALIAGLIFTVHMNFQAPDARRFLAHHQASQQRIIERNCLLVLSYFYPKVGQVFLKYVK